MEDMGEVKDKKCKDIIYYIYKIVNQINGKMYIGYTNDIKRRVAEHIKSSRLHISNTNCQYIHKAIKKYGFKNFTLNIINCANTKKRIIELEMAYIKYYESFGLQGYNLTKGGDGRSGPCSKETIEKLKKYKASDEVRKKISETHKKNKNNAGANSFSAKLTDSDIHEIRNLHYNENLSNVEIAKKYNVKPCSIGKIINGLTWKNVSINPSIQKKVDQINKYPAKIRRSINSHKTKLNVDDVIKIRKFYDEEKLSLTKIHQLYPELSYSTICYVARRISWKHV